MILVFPDWGNGGPEKPDVVALGPRVSQLQPRTLPPAWSKFTLLDILQAVRHGRCAAPPILQPAPHLQPPGFA